MQTLRTVQDVINFLKNYPPDSEVFYDTNKLNGGTFEYLVSHPDNDSPLNYPKSVSFVSWKGW